MSEKHKVENPYKIGDAVMYDGQVSQVVKIQKIDHPRYPVLLALNIPTGDGKFRREVAYPDRVHPAI